MTPIGLVLVLVAAVPTTEPAPDLAVRVRAVFAARCTGCHGPDLPRPKNGFGYVTDLRKLASNGALVEPSHPEKSELWELVRRGEMPPADSPQGPLTTDEKETIRAWIVAGAPAISADPPAPTRSFPALGKFHILVLHFPIALSLAAALGELLAWRRSLFPSHAGRFCMWLAAIAALPTALLGWVFAWEGQGKGSLLPVHAWLGTAAATWLFLTALGYEWAVRSGRGSLWARLAVLAGAALTGVAAHFGGMLVWGADFFNL
jgi:mono/diheme cytochrome c family protein